MVLPVLQNRLNKRKRAILEQYRDSFDVMDVLGIEMCVEIDGVRHKVVVCEKKESG